MTFQKVFSVFVHLEYIVLFGLAFKSDFGASCSDSKVYRKFTLKLMLFSCCVFPFVYCECGRIPFCNALQTAWPLEHLKATCTGRIRH